MVRCLLCFLYEPMQQDHIIIGNTEDDPCYTTIAYVASDFPERIPQRATYRHPNWPAEFRSLNIEPNDPTIFKIQLQQPFANWFPAPWSLIKPGFQFFRLVNHINNCVIFDATGQLSKKRPLWKRPDIFKIWIALSRGRVARPSRPKCRQRRKGRARLRPRNASTRQPLRNRNVAWL